MARTVDVQMKVPDITRKQFKIIFLAHFALTAFAMMAWPVGVSSSTPFKHYVVFTNTFSGTFLHQPVLSCVFHLEPDSAH
jgi:hypothetical protein